MLMKFAMESQIVLIHRTSEKNCASQQYVSQISLNATTVRAWNGLNFVIKTAIALTVQTNSIAVDQPRVASK